jgi:purine nucleosidase
MNMKKRVIIDCDPGIDDSLALMYALSSEALEVVGITVVCGNVPTDLGVENARKVCRLMGRMDIPVYAGAEAPLERELVTAQDTHGMDGLGESDIEPVSEALWPHSSLKGDDGRTELPEGVRFLLQSLEEGPLSIIAIGPLTNIAMALFENPSAFASLESFVSMGGNFKSFGNCSPVAEFNYWVDPEAGRYVYEHLNCPVEMVGLDVTRKIVLTPKMIENLKRLKDPLADFIVKITGFYVDFHKKQEGIDGCVINDPLAVGYFLNKDLCSGFFAYTTIETEGLSVGQSIVDEKGFWKKTANSRVLTEVDADAFMRQFMTGLFGSRGEAVSG